MISQANKISSVLPIAKRRRKHILSRKKHQVVDGKKVIIRRKIKLKLEKTNRIIKVQTINKIMIKTLIIRD